MIRTFYIFLALVFLGITSHSLPASAACGGGQHCRSATFKNWNHKDNISKRTYASKKYTGRKYASRKRVARQHYAFSKRNSVGAGVRNQVVGLITALAPRYGVPTWFALRIAKVESGYNPRAHGRAGEIGVFQLKCQTARGLGYRGNCGGLYNASANVQFGLKHLSLAIKSSRGNLKLAASKHNGGLGRKRLVPSYVRMVF